MKYIRIYGLPSHQTPERTSGVDFVRIIQPLQHLNGYKDDEIQIETQIFQITDKTDWLEVCKNFDIIYFNYLNSPWGFAAMGAMARKLGRKIVMDLDDNLWGIREDNPAFSVYHTGSQALRDFTAICNEVDYMTTTNSYLKNMIINSTYKRAEKIKVFPNYIDLSLYQHQSPFKNTLNIQLMHHGSTTHFEDLSSQEFIKGIDMIMKEYPNVTVRFVGAFLPKLKELWGMRYETAYGDTDIYKWISEKYPKFMDEADIIVVPLEENSYTRCKSSIKWIETSAAKKPGVWQAVRQYQEVITGKNGLLAKSEGDWYTQIKRLIDNPELRRNMGEQAFADTKKDWQIQDHIKDYAEFFKMVIDK